MRIEATHYLDRVDLRAKLPYLGRLNTYSYIQSLYHRKAVCVSIIQVDEYFIKELEVKFISCDKRLILFQILKGSPDIIEECIGDIFKLKWLLPKEKG